LIEVLQKRNQYVIIRQSGVGKTTFINALANYLVNDTLKQALNDDMQVLIPFCFLMSPRYIRREIIGMGKEDVMKK